MADMDHQPRKDLSGLEAGKKVKEIAGDARTCMFSTDVTQFPGDTRPMAIQEVDEDGTVWFISSSESEKNRDIGRDARVVLTFQNDDQMSYLSLSGQTSIHNDKATIDKYWTAFAKAWFDGKDDPRVTIIRVRPERGHYWESKSGKMVAMAKMTLTAITGSKMDDGGVDGELTF